MTSVPSRREYGENQHPRSRRPSRLPIPAHETQSPHPRDNRKIAHRPLPGGTNVLDPLAPSRESREASGVLNTATKHRDRQDRLYSVFLSGNGPLVAVLREALARDHVLNERTSGRSLRLAEARRRVKAFIQNVHEFRDECLRDPSRAPIVNAD